MTCTAGIRAVVISWTVKLVSASWRQISAQASHATEERRETQELVSVHSVCLQPSAARGTFGILTFATVSRESGHNISVRSKSALMGLCPASIVPVRALEVRKLVRKATSGANTSVSASKRQGCAAS